MIPTDTAPHTPDASSRETRPTHWLPDQPLPASGEGRQSTALTGWLGAALVSNKRGHDINLTP
jgi:hypothetical protein